ncbi:amidohydrolase family protein [Streptomyces sp. FXJ1.4098]|nr:amidohydrolase family protein [Streptomyces sp. FXJ1.4098]
MNGDIRAGVIDVHAHWLPRSLLALPPGNPLGGMNDRDGELFLGESPLSFPTAAMTDIDTIVADTRKAGLGARVISAPPFAFPVHAPAEADDYIAAYNEQLADAVSRTDGTLVGLGLVRLDDVDAARRELTRLAATEGIAGVAVPPVVDGRSYDRGVPREVLGIAAALGLSVLVHPMQLPRAEWDHHYLVNLIGNPVESTTAVAAVLLAASWRNTRTCGSASSTAVAAHPPCWAGGDTAGAPATTCAKEAAVPGGVLHPPLLRHDHPRPRAPEAAACPRVARPDRLRQRLPLRHGAARPGRIPARPWDRRRDTRSERP